MLIGIPSVTGKAGISFVTQNIYSLEFDRGRLNDWGNSSSRSHLNNSFAAEQGLTDYVVSVEKAYLQSESATFALTCSDLAWVFSFDEIYSNTESYKSYIPQINTRFSVQNFSQFYE